MNRSTVMLAGLWLTACSGTPATPQGTPTPASPSASASTSTPSSAPAVKGGMLHFTFTNTEAAQPNPGTGYDAESIFGTAATPFAAAGVFANAGKPDRNVSLSLGTTMPKAGDSFPLQNTSPFTPGYLQYSTSDGAAVQPKTYLWSATSGTVKVDGVDGKTVSFTYVDALMSPKNDTGNPNNGTSVGTFTLNGSGRVDNFPDK